VPFGTRLTVVSPDPFSMASSPRPEPLFFLTNVPLSSRRFCCFGAAGRNVPTLNDGSAAASDLACARTASAGRERSSSALGDAAGHSGLPVPLSSACSPRSRSASTSSWCAVLAASGAVTAASLPAPACKAVADASKAALSPLAAAANGAFNDASTAVRAVAYSAADSGLSSPPTAPHPVSSTAATAPTHTPLPGLRATPCSVTAQSIEQNDGRRCPVWLRTGDRPEADTSGRASFRSESRGPVSTT
jgi:hypothetical protein